MWDEEIINKKIKDAADQYHPAYDDNAWNKMEQMLDEHLPRKRDRRRIIYFLPLVVLLAGLTFFIISTKKTIPASKISEKSLLKSDPGTTENEHQNVASVEAAANPGTDKTGNSLVPAVKEQNKVLKEKSNNAVSHDTKKIDNLSTHGTVKIANGNAHLAAKTMAGNQETESDKAAVEVNVDNSGKQNSAVETINQGEKSPGKGIESAVTAGNNNPIQKLNTDAKKDDKETITKGDEETAKLKDAAKPGSREDANATVKQKKTKKSFIQNFGFGLSAGPDISAVKLNDAGKVTLAYGAQVSYSFTDKFTLRTGFYVAKKIYSVSDNEYHVPPGATWSNYLESVDANCKVYEVPVTLSYSFGKTKNHSWFASAGLSSYFMKRESYVYYYKNPAGATWNNPWTVTNKNKHYFSVLDISGGYEYSINKRFSISAEPYVKLPFSGIGIGKIKLNSAGVLFSIAVKPF